MLWFNKSKEEESYDNLEEAFEWRKDENEDPLHGYNDRAMRKRSRDRRSALEEDEQCFNEVLREEEKAAKKAREKKPASREAGEDIAEESISNNFWKSVFGGK